MMIDGGVGISILICGVKSKIGEKK